MELVAPAGNLEKLKYAYLYGADAAYIGLPGFSLRAQADNFALEDLPAAAALKNGKKLYGAFNIAFTDPDLAALEETLSAVPTGVFDAFIVSDPGAVPRFRKHFPATPLHLSTQANCTNSEAARVYGDLGFTRIIAARELRLKEIEAMKRASGLEIEVFGHGAMCLSYSGRCHLSAYLAGRSANRGDCAHACRWEYRVLEESARPGEYLPVIEGENFTSLLSSRDLCLIDHLDALRDAGVDALKIEGRMKSAYYAAITARAYRRGIDIALGKSDEDLAPYKADLFNVSHREFSTGFLFGKEEISRPTLDAYRRAYLFLGAVGERQADGLYSLDLKNRLTAGEEIEYVGWDVPFIQDAGFELYDEHRARAPHINHGKIAFLKTDRPVKTGYLVRKKIH
jgi:U32 family peptidase